MEADIDARYTPSPRSLARRRPQRATYDKAAVHRALDAHLLAHVGWVLDGQPFVTPTAFWRVGGALFWHGSAGSRMLAAVADGGPVCVTVSALDGLVVGRSGFAHSVNYHSVMAFGRARTIDEPSAKRDAMNRFIGRLYPGRPETLRPITEAELAQIVVVRMEIEEASLKAREGPPAALASDEGWPAWAGVLPVCQAVGEAVPDTASAALPPGAGLADYRDGALFSEILGRAAHGDDADPG